MKKLLTAVWRTVVACIAITVVVFLGYYLAFGLNVVCTQLMNAIELLWSYLKGNYIAVIVIAILICAGGFFAELFGEILKGKKFRKSKKENTKKEGEHIAQ